MKRELVILLALCSVLLATGCAENGTEPAGEEPAETVTPTEEPIEPATEVALPEGTPIAPVQREIPETPDESENIVEVSIVNSSFEPETVTITAGDTVRWTNLDPESHDVRGTGTNFGSTALAQGGSYEFLFTDPGTYEYYCSIHPSMKGTVVVTEKE